MKGIKTSMLNKLREEFFQYFGEGSEPRTFFSPSRINIIGEHIDYNGGMVFPCAIEIGTYGLARKNDKNSLRLKSINFDKTGEVDLADLTYDEDKDWLNYAAGMSKFIDQAGYKIGGLDILIYGNIPNGSGLSSSASLELLLGQIINAIYNQDKISRLDLVKFGQKTENDFFGLKTGIMDQFVIGFGKKDQAIYLNTNSLEYDYVPFKLKDHKIVIMNTNKRRELKDSKYNQRRAECDEALVILKNYRPDIEYLCDLGQEDLHLLENIQDQTIRNRARHAIEENIRVKEATQALGDNDIVKLGNLLKASDDSLRDLYEVTGPHLDSMTKHANALDYCLGARMTGAGFAGCAIAIVENDKIEEFKQYVGENYKKDTGLEAEFIMTSIGQGTREI
ncbi:MAG: galactokinase [Tissierellia bacterium]|nr:galactokinase [Tissierellia bacterium]